MGNDNIFTLLNNPGDVEFPEVAQNNFNWSMPNPANEYVSPYVDSPFFKFRTDTNICINEDVSLISNALGNKNYMYQYYFEGSDEVSDLLEIYKSNQGHIKDYSMLLYYEENNPNKSNFFGTFFMCDMGNEYKKMLLRAISGKGDSVFHDLYGNEMGIPNSTDDLVESYQLILNQKNNDDIDRDTIFFALAYSLSFKQESNKGVFGFDEEAAKWIRKLVTKLDSIKFTHDEYNFIKEEEKNKDDKSAGIGDVLNSMNDVNKLIAETLFNILVPPKVQSFIKTNAVTFVKEVIIKSLPPKMQRMLEGIISKAQETLDVILKGFEYVKELIEETGKMLTALLMGLANGFLSFLQLLIEIVAWSVDNILGNIVGLDMDKSLNGTKYLESRKRMEVMEDVYDFLSDNLNQFYDSVKNLWDTFDVNEIYKIGTILKNKVGEKMDGITRYDVAYFCGALVFEILLGIGLALLTGGASVIAQASTKAEKLAQLLKIAVQETISTVTMGIYDLLKLFKALFTKFITVAKNAKTAFKDFIEYIKELLTKKADEIAQEAEKLPLPKTLTYSTLVPIPTLSPQQQRLFKAASRVFYKDMKILLRNLTEDAKVFKKWYRLKPLRALVKEDIDVLIELRKSKIGEEAYNNVAILKSKVEINGEIVTIEHKAFSGKGDLNNPEGFCKVPNASYIAKQLDMPVQEFTKQFDTLVKDKVIPRFYDSEHKILSTFDDEILKLKAFHGDAKVKVLEMNYKTLFEPCTSCKRQIIIRQTKHNSKLIVEAAEISKDLYVRTNKQLLTVLN